MDIEEIKKLMEMMAERGVVELEIKNASGEIRLVRENHRVAHQQPTVVVAAPQAHMAPPFPAPPIANAPVAVAVPPVSEPDASLQRGAAIPSPMVGTFYRAPKPDAKPYVDIGSVVEVGEVVCIVEAMKMMNEIQSEIRGRVIKIMAENGKPVEYGQPLFLLEPL
ncbi:MAG: acetyl-CoA carboxylase biotin carboxyl carrier protein [Deltaproteobacteria bacterium]|nr:acetyl-CoA carboxylase biotin carboxyl carrier protein [Deltaproteobacteria bacterium]